MLDSVNDDFDATLNESHRSMKSQISVATQPKQAYGKVKEKLVELEIERDENLKALEYLKQLREKEKTELTQNIQLAKEQGHKQAEELKKDMQNRLEKQVQMIESLLEDKKSLY